MINLFQLNDLNIKGFLKIILAIQLAMWGVISLDAIGLQIPIIRQLIGFIYLTFIPGIIILRILRLHKLGNIETMLYTVGLSIATLMLTGLIMNTLYPSFGISGPISTTPLIITISVAVLILCIICYVRDNDFSDPSFVGVGDTLSPPLLFLCLLPFLSIFWTYLVNFYNNNIVLMFLIVIIALIALLIGFDKFIPKNLYPLAVLVIAISLLYYRSLITMYLWGWDPHFELYVCDLVKMNSIWDLIIPETTNAMLSLTMLAPIYSIILNMDLTWVFKIIYPLLFSLVPLGLYRIFQKQTNEKIAFLSCFFFVSVSSFYMDMPALARQEIAELFLVLLILLMIDKDMNKINRSFLFIVFGISLAVSHYGLSYIYMFCLIFAWLILVSTKNLEMQRLRNNFYTKLCKYKNREFASNPVSSKIEDRTISSIFILFFITFALTWYMYVSSCSTFVVIVQIGDHVASSFFTDFLNPETAEGLSLLLTEPLPGLLHEVNRVINYLNQIFIVIGCVVLLLRHREMKFEREYATLSMLNLVILFACVSVPFFAISLNMTRLYHITLIFLAPFCVIGGIAVFRAMSKVVKASWSDQCVRNSLTVLSVYFVIFLLFNTGFVCVIAKDHPCGGSLNQNWVREHGDIKAKIAFYSGYDPEQNIVSLKWLSERANKEDIKIYACWGLLAQITGYGMIPPDHVLELSTTSEIDSGAYVYLGYLNVVEGIMPERAGYYNTTEIAPHLNTTNEIYSNGNSEIYYYE